MTSSADGGEQHDEHPGEPGHADSAHCVRHGLGIALLPHFIIPDRDDLARLTVTGADLTWPMSLAVPAARAPSAAARVPLAMIAG